MRLYSAFLLLLCSCVSTRELVVRDAGVSSNAYAVTISDQQATMDVLYRLEQQQIVDGPGDRTAKTLAVDRVRVAWARPMALLELAAAVHRRLAGQVVLGDAGAVQLDLDELRDLTRWIGAAIAEARTRIVRR